MASFDESTGEIVVRIVYDGLGTAGKTTNLRMLHAAFPTRSRDGLIVPAESTTGRTLYFDWLELVAGHLDQWPLRCQVLTVPGQFAYANRRFQLLQEIDGVVLVCESTPKGVEAGRIAAGFLSRALESSGNAGAPVVLQANKQDLDDALSPEEVAARLPIQVNAVVPARATEGDGVRLTLLRVLDLVRVRVRERLVGTSGMPLPRSKETAEELHTALVAADADASPALVEALEDAMSQVRS